MPKSPPDTGDSRVRYFFHISNGDDTVRDDEGMVLSSIGEAMFQIAVIAAELAQEAAFAGYTVYVSDEQGNEISRIQVCSAI